MASGTYAPAFMDTTDPTFVFNLFDVTQTSQAETNVQNELLLNVYSSSANTISVGVGQMLVLMGTIAQGNGTNGGTQYIPIASVNGAQCTYGNPASTPCLLLGESMDGSTGNSWRGHYFAVPFTVSSPPGYTQIGVYPADICTDFQQMNSEPNPNWQFGKSTTGTAGIGCDPSANTVAPSGGTNQDTMQLTFELHVPQSTGVTGITGTAATAQDTGSFNLSFQNSGSNFTCPDLSSVYVPGDSQIIVDTTQFGLNVGSGFAPAFELITAANEGQSVALDNTFATANSIEPPNRGLLGGPVNVGGFTNSDPSTGIHDYTVGFMMKDYAGLVYPATSACTMFPVQTSQILGFLNKSNCFIATAAFRDTDAGPVLMLREFRDRVLLTNLLGRAFVRWYYRNSPPAAVWLMEHPQYRGPVLIALAPLQLEAWLLLHPAGLGLAICLLLVAVGNVAQARREVGGAG
jgi:hypothetical protein